MEGSNLTFDPLFKIKGRLSFIKFFYISLNITPRLLQYFTIFSMNTTSSDILCILHTRLVEYINLQ